MKPHNQFQYGTHYTDQLVNPLAFYKKRLRKAEALLKETLAQLDTYWSPEIRKKIGEFLNENSPSK